MAKLEDVIASPSSYKDIEVFTAFQHVRDQLSKLEEGFDVLSKEVSRRLSLGTSPAGGTTSPRGGKKRKGRTSSKHDWAGYRETLPAKMKKGEWISGSEARTRLGFEAANDKESTQFSNSVLNALVTKRVLKTKGKLRSKQYTLR